MCKRALLFGLLIALCSVPALADVEVRFFDEGSLIVGASVSIKSQYTEDKLAPSSDGTYIVGADIGQKITLEVSTPTQQYVPVTVSVLADVIDVDVVARQANDMCADAVPVAVPSVTGGTTIGSTNDPEAPLCGTSITAPGVWYSVIGTGTQMTASTCNDGNPDTGSADYDSKLNVYCQGCDTLTCVGGNDDGPGCLGFSSLVSWCSEADQEYLILVQGFFGSIGNFNLAVYDNGVPCTGGVACAPPPPTGACCNCLPAPFNCTVGTLDECLALDGQFQGDGTNCGDLVVTDSSPGLPINAANTLACDTITVADSLIINDVNVSMGITHTWIGDLSVSVAHNGTSTVLWDNRCGSNDNINSTADDEGLESLCVPIGEGPIFDVRWPPALAGLGPLSIYDGMDSAGDWELCVLDTFPSLDDGTFDYWALQFNDQQSAGPCDNGGGDLVGFCHCPPGHNVYDANGMCIENNHCRTIDIAEPAIPSHLAEHACDYVGPCLDGADTSAEEMEAVFAPVDETNGVFGGR